jgi:hypothetical protein
VSPAEAALIVGLVALVGALATNLLAARASRRAAFVQELRTRTADAFREAFVVQHAMEWVTWHARNDPDALDEAMKRDYASEVHRALPALLGSIATIAALSIGAYQAMQPVLDKLYGCEERVGLALRFVADPGPKRSESIERLDELLDEAQQLYRDLPTWIAHAMALADQR